jgi:hypothetical protein
MFGRVLDRMEAGTFEVAAHELGQPRPEAIRLIEQLRKRLAEREG